MTLVPQSQAEQEIRTALVAHLRRVLPGARIIHELDTYSGCRADVAAVCPEMICLFEIKSERDTIDRLAHQMRVFHRHSHFACAVLHWKWFDHQPYQHGEARMVAPDDVGSCAAWAYPQPDPGHSITSDWYRWGAPWLRIGQPPLAYHRQINIPHARDLIGLLHDAEVKLEARHAGVDLAAARYAHERKDLACLHMTGRQVSEAVCRRLRARPFADADPPVVDSPSRLTPPDTA